MAIDRNYMWACLSNRIKLQDEQDFVGDLVNRVNRVKFLRQDEQDEHDFWVILSIL